MRRRTKLHFGISMFLGIETSGIREETFGA